MKDSFLDKLITNENKANLYWIKAPIYKRIIAFIIDLFIIFPIQNLTRPIHNLLPVVAIALYFILLESSRWQGTIGKRVLGLKIEHQNGTKLNYKESFMRYIIKVFTLALIGIGYWPLFVHKQALCDKFIDSEVYALDLRK